MLKKIVFILLLSCVAPVQAWSAEEPEVRAFTWQECVKEAAKNHPDLIAAQEQVKQSEAQKKIDASAEYPRVDAAASGSVSRRSGDNTESYSAGVSGSQLLFDGKKTINAVKSSDQTIKAQQQNFRFVSADVRQRLRSAFVTMLKDQELERIAREIYEIRRGNFELIALRYQSGLEHRGALLTADANLAEAQYGIAQALRDLEVSKKKLEKEMGARVPGAFQVREDFAVKDAGEAEDLERIADSHPSVMKIDAQTRAAEFDLKSTYGNYAPEVSLQGSAQRSGDSIPPKENELEAGLTVSLPLFEGGLRKAQVSQATASLNQLKANRISMRDGVLVTLQESQAALKNALQTVGVQKKSLEAAQERSKIAQAQYSIGTITFDSWTIIEDNLVSAKRSYLNAQADALLKEALWIQAKGETLEYEN